MKVFYLSGSVFPGLYWEVLPICWESCSTQYCLHQHYWYSDKSQLRERKGYLHSDSIHYGADFPPFSVSFVRDGSAAESPQLCFFRRNLAQWGK